MMGLEAAMAFFTSSSTGWDQEDVERDDAHVADLVGANLRVERRQMSELHRLAVRLVANRARPCRAGRNRRDSPTESRVPAGPSRRRSGAHGGARSVPRPVGTGCASWWRPAPGRPPISVTTYPGTQAGPFRGRALAHARDGRPPVDDPHGETRIAEGRPRRRVEPRRHPPPAPRRPHPPPPGR